MSSWRSARVPFAVVAVKGLRIAAMNAHRARALDPVLGAGVCQL